MAVYCIHLNARACARIGDIIKLYEVHMVMRSDDIETNGAGASVVMMNDYDYFNLSWLCCEQVQSHSIRMTMFRMQRI